MKDPKKKAAATAKETGKNLQGFFTNFSNFVREQGVVGLAVGLAIGTSAGATVKTIVNEFIDPIVGFILGGVDLGDMRLIAKFGDRTLNIGWGAILSSVIVLLATAFVVYGLVRIAKLDRLDKSKD